MTLALKLERTSPAAYAAEVPAASREKAAGGRIAYIVSRFPRLTETFVLREMVELERLGEQIELFSLLHPQEQVKHPEATDWERRAHYAPFVSGPILAANARAFLRAPRQYLGLYARALRKTRQTPNFWISALGLFPKLIWFAEQMQASGVGHIHAHFATHPALAAWVISQWSGIPYSFTIHAHDLYVHTTMLAEKVKQAKFVVTISEFNRRRVAELCGEQVLPKVHVIHCGIEPERFRRAHPQGQRDSFRIVSAAALEEYKGLEYLIAACAEARREIPQLECLIAGRGELRAKLQKQIEAAGLGDCVKLLGGQSQEQVAELMAGADLFVLPSVVLPNGKMEGLPVSIMEAMASELPVISTKISGIPELVEEGETGRLVKPRDAGALAQAIVKLYNHPTTRKEMGTRARARVAQEFGLGDNVKRLQQYLDSQ